MKAAIYARVSRGTGPERGQSLLNQIRVCREYAQRYGWRVVAEFVENERHNPGESLNLSKLTQLIDDAATGEFDIIIATDIDRLSRRLAKQILIEEELKSFDVKIVYTNDTYPDTSDGNLMKHIKTIIAEYEQIKTAERIARGIRTAVEAGNVMTTGVQPYGYKLTEQDGKRKFAVLKDEASIVRLIFKWYTVGNSDFKHPSTTDIAQKLSKLRIPTPNYNRGRSWNVQEIYGTWTHGAITKILSNTTYYGCWRFGKSTKCKESGKSIINSKGLIDVSVSSIIPRDQWNEAQSRKVRNIHRGRTWYQFLLRKRLRCLNCNALLSSIGERRKSGKTFFYIYCTNAWVKPISCKNRFKIHLYCVDRAVAKWLNRLYGEKAFKDFQKQLKKEYLNRIDNAIIDLKNLVEKFEDQSDRLDSLSELDFISDQMVIVRRININITIDSISEEIDELKAKRKLVELSFIPPDDPTAIDNIYNEQTQFSFLTHEKLFEHLEVHGLIGNVDGSRIAYIKSIVGEATFKLPDGTHRNRETTVREIKLRPDTIKKYFSHIG